MTSAARSGSTTCSRSSPRSRRIWCCLTSPPPFNGYHWCREIRRVSKVPILFLTSAGDSVNTVMAMQMGGDDLLAKPFDLQVLSAKVQAMLRRAYDFGPAAQLLSCGGAVLNVSDGTLDAAGQRVELTRNELRILQMLLERKGQTVSREALMTGLGVRQLCGREHPDGEHRPSAAEAGGGRASGPDPHPEGRGVSGGGVRNGADLLSEAAVEAAALLAGITAVFAAVFSHRLGGLAYAALLCLTLGAVLFGLGYSAFLRRHRELEHLLRRAGEPVLPLPPPRRIGGTRPGCGGLATRVRLAAENRDRLEDLTDYYTLWAHQIKTPIAAARLLLQEDPGTVSGEVEVELLKIEQYVEMVLGYPPSGQRLHRLCVPGHGPGRSGASGGAEVRPDVHSQKDHPGLRETGRHVVTDGKWLSFVVEQVLSNALKYTPAGGHHPDLRRRGDGGDRRQRHRIREEDLPRVFEKGFTGYNGREDKKSTGIGLYLCRRVMDRLNHGISIVSRPGQGTLVRLDLSRGSRVAE